LIEIFLIWREKEGGSVENERRTSEKTAGSSSPATDGRPMKSDPQGSNST